MNEPCSFTNLYCGHANGEPSSVNRLVDDMATVNFPPSDLSEAERRPELVGEGGEHDDIIRGQITHPVAACAQCAGIREQQK